MTRVSLPMPVFVLLTLGAGAGLGALIAVAAMRSPSTGAGSSSGQSTSSPAPTLRVDVADKFIRRATLEEGGDYIVAVLLRGHLGPGDRLGVEISVRAREVIGCPGGLGLATLLERKDSAQALPALDRRSPSPPDDPAGSIVIDNSDLDGWLTWRLDALADPTCGVTGLAVSAELLQADRSVRDIELAHWEFSTPLSPRP